MHARTHTHTRARAQVLLMRMGAFNAVIMFIKFFRYVRFHGQFALVIETIILAISDMTSLAVIIVIIRDQINRQGYLII